MNTTEKMTKIQNTLTMPCMTEEELIKLGEANGFDFEGAIYFDGAYWKPYCNLDVVDLYLISTDGRIWNTDTRHYCAPTLDKYRHDSGRYRVMLNCATGHKWFYRYRLMAECFIPNPKGLATINHKDENPNNDNLLNLEWMSYIDNLNYGTRNKRLAETLHQNAVAKHSKA